MDPQALRANLVAWLRRRVDEAGAKGIAVGMSGGLDSSVVAALAKQAFPSGVIGVVMPCFSDPADRDDALLVCDAFSIPSVTVDLSSAWELLLSAADLALGLDRVEQSDRDETVALSRANAKPRLRMATLYYIAGLKQYLVVGTENRVELALGYFTKHGDGGVDLLPLGNLVKSQVRQLGEALGLPEKILSKPPSAGLWEGQTDEAEIGIGYEALDRYFLTGEGEREVVEKIKRLEAASAHKRRFPSIPDIQW